MECYITDKNHNKLDYLQNFNSLIWTERYSSFGDFELLVPIDSQYLPALKPDNHLELVGSDYVMIIEDVLATESKDVRQVKVTGRSMESILERRTIDKNLNMPPTVLNLIFMHLRPLFVPTPSAANPSVIFNAGRAIPGFTLDETIPSGVIERPVAQYDFAKKTAYAMVEEICRDHDVGFRVRVMPDKTLRFSLFKGADKATAGAANSVVFAPSMQNIKNYSYLETSIGTANVAVMNFGEYDARLPYVVVWLGPNEPKGMDRREMVVDVTNLRIEPEDITPIDYQIMTDNARLIGQIELRAAQRKIVLDGEIELGMPPHYRHQYRMGDIVLFYHSKNIQTRYRVTEYIRSYTDTGSSEYPTFEAVVE